MLNVFLWYAYICTHRKQDLVVYVTVVLKNTFKYQQMYLMTVDCSEFATGEDFLKLCLELWKVR